MESNSFDEDSMTVADEVKEEEKRKSLEQSMGHGTLRWQDKDIRKLIQFWGDRPALYDTTADSYYLRCKRREALDEIIAEFGLSEKEIHQKMISLRTYYGSQQRKKIAWDNDSTKIGPFKSRWQYWQPLSFLNDHMMTQRQLEANINISTTLEGDSLEGPATRISQKFVVENHDTNFEKDIEDITRVQEAFPFEMKKKHETMSQTTKQYHQQQGAREKKRRFEFATDVIDNKSDDEKRRRNQVTETVNNKSDDELFVAVLLKSLSKIAEGEAKEALKLNIQNLVFRTRFGPQNLLGGSSCDLQLQPQCAQATYNGSPYQNNSDSGFHLQSESDCEPSMISRRKSERSL